VEKTIGAFGKRAKEGTLALEDMTGGMLSILFGFYKLCVCPVFLFIMSA
jgi:hypothetical protein